MQSGRKRGQGDDSSTGGKTQAANSFNMQMNQHTVEAYKGALRTMYTCEDGEGTYDETNDGVESLMHDMKHIDLKSTIYCVRLLQLAQRHSEIPGTARGSKSGSKQRDEERKQRMQRRACGRWQKPYASRQQNQSCMSDATPDALMEASRVRWPRVQRRSAAL